MPRKDLVWTTLATERINRNIEPIPRPTTFLICDADAHGNVDQAKRMQDNVGYTQPCSGPTRWAVDGLTFCNKHLVQSGR